jgi:hypothetical protein
MTSYKHLDLKKLRIVRGDEQVSPYVIVDTTSDETPGPRSNTAVKITIYDDDVI